jgi:Fe-S-cluster-containing dehydrogenase component
VGIGSFWQKILRIGPNPKYEGAEFPDVEMYFLPVGCQHCENPLCVTVCPTGASQKMADGTVQIDKQKCIGCQFCVMSCPYNVRYLNKEERVVEKCTLCTQLIDFNEIPKCVQLCSARARYFGDRDEGIESLVGPGEIKLGEFIEPFSDDQIHHLPDVGNRPSFAYILRDRTWKG